MATSTPNISEATAGASTTPVTYVIPHSINPLDVNFTNTSMDVNTTQGAFVPDAAFLNSLLVGNWYNAYDIPLVIMYTFYFLFGLGNWFVVCCICFSKKLRVPFNGIVLAMSVTDGLTTSVVIPMEMAQLFSKFTYNDLVYCRARIVLKSFCYLSSLMFILTISVVRLLSAMRTSPLKISFKIVGGIITFIYVISGPLTFLALDERSSTFDICRGTLVHDEEVDQTVSWLIYFILSVTMFVATILCYVVIFIILKYREHTNMAGSSSSSGKNEILTLKVAAIVTITFAIAYLTPFLAIVVKAPFSHNLHYLALMGAFLFTTNALNPIIYTFSSSVFRRGAATIVRQKCMPLQCLFRRVTPSSLNDTSTLAAPQSNLSQRAPPLSGIAS